MKLIARGLTLLAMLATVQCGSSTSPTNPNSTMNVVLGASSVPAGATTQGTVSLNAPQTGSVNIALSSSNPAVATVPAPAGGALVALSSSGPVIMPASVTVSAGETSTRFSISTRPGGGGLSATITASYGGASVSAVLSVTKPSVAIARFGVTGPTETETCEMSNGGRTLNCTFDGNTSSAPGNIVAYDWSYAVAGTFAQTTSGPVLTNP